MKHPKKSGWKLLKSGQYKYKPKQKIMFVKNIESIFETHSQTIKNSTS